MLRNFLFSAVQRFWSVSVGHEKWHHRQEREGWISCVDRVVG